MESLVLQDGANMSRRLLRGGQQCVVFDRSSEAVEELVQENAIGSASLVDFVKNLEKPRSIWLMIPAAAVDGAIETSSLISAPATS